MYLQMQGVKNPDSISIESCDFLLTSSQFWPMGYFAY